ncbi:hypothetical protein Caci_2906 [Catenulispora acidiphila DSM 44928]|uniref:Transcriptional regulator n=1 Tax=Catenulispora acidiphila (strain DSM 44928 / JCM 14897 / NBRC 102108 / NRRL B-24433 / ID139908) TaxID=479433 RepID=C7Q2S3_CATAD|nr:hypothetical protein [Catenulispora acidiphila]ACU71815.1 hypothetical protein Caci_2906 [Catenulispora acidiphila DSM 44928]
MRDLEAKILASLAEEDEPLSWVGLVNSICPWPAGEIPDAFDELLAAGLIEVVGAGVSGGYVITDAGRAALATTTEERS